MNRQRLALSVGCVVAVLVATAGISVAATPKCVKVGQKTTIKGVVNVCTKVGNKLQWVPTPPKKAAAKSAPQPGTSKLGAPPTPQPGTPPPLGTPQSGTPQLGAPPTPQPGSPPPLGTPPSPGGGASSAAGGSTAAPASVPLTYGLIWSVGSLQSGLGNVSDPALLQFADGRLRMFFKNGNEKQSSAAGFDNKIHSYVSSDSGASWTLESGVRIDVQSPVTVRAAESGGYEAWGWIPAGGVDAMTRFTSMDGKDFTKGSGAAVPTSACVSKDGVKAGFLGDPQVVKVAGGFLAYA